MLRQNPFYLDTDDLLRELRERVQLPDEGATVAKSQLFSVKEGLDYTVDEGGAAVMSEKGFERLTAAHRRGFEVVITVGDHVIFALPAEIAAA